MTKPKKNQRKKQKESDSIRITKTKDKENAEKPLNIDDTPLNVARSFLASVRISSNRQTHKSR